MSRFTRYGIVFGLCFLLLTGSPPCYADSNTETGAIIGAGLGVCLANWGKPLFRNTFIVDNLIGISIGGITGAGLGIGLVKITPIVSGLTAATTITSLTGGAIGFAKGLDADRSLGKETWNGFSLGAVAPGVLTGGTIGAGLGVSYLLMRRQDRNERTYVGYTSAGMGLFGSTGYISAGSGIGQLINPTGGWILGTGMALSLARTVNDGRIMGKKVSGPDYETHPIISGYMARRNGQGSALLVGYFKESRDYFMQSGTPEWRDLKNNWRGIFNTNQGPF